MLGIDEHAHDESTQLRVVDLLEGLERTVAAVMATLGESLEAHDATQFIL